LTQRSTQDHAAVDREGCRGGRTREKGVATISKGTRLWGNNFY